MQTRVAVLACLRKCAERERTLRSCMKALESEERGLAMCSIERSSTARYTRFCVAVSSTWRDVGGVRGPWLQGVVPGRAQVGVTVPGIGALSRWVCHARATNRCTS